MQTVNIRQLKVNPSTAIRQAKEEDVVVVMNRDNPEALLVSLDKLGFPEPAAVRVALAVSLFKNGAISVGFAARMAKKSVSDMLTLLSSQGIPVASPDTEDARHDMQRAREWLDKQS